MVMVHDVAQYRDTAGQSQEVMLIMYMLHAHTVLPPT